MQIIPINTPSVLHVEDQYIWLEDLNALPLTASFDAICNSEDNQVIPMFSFNKNSWDEGDCDALSWFVSPYSDTFTFRTKLFGEFPEVTRAQKDGKPWIFKPAVGEKFNVSCHITSTTATYSINGQEYATATYAVGDIPLQGYIGFACFGAASVEISQVNVQAREVVKPLSPVEISGLVYTMMGFMTILDAILKGEATSTDVTAADVDTMLQNAMQVFRGTGAVNKLNRDQVHAAIDRVYEKANADLTRLYDEEISEQALSAASAAAGGIGALLSFFPPAALVADATSIATLAASFGLQIDIAVEGPNIIAEAASLRENIDKQPELAAAKAWNDAQTAELTTLGRIKAAPPSPRTSAFLYSLILTLVRRHPKKSDAEIIDDLKALFANTADLITKYPDLGQTIAIMVATEDDGIIEAKMKDILVAVGGDVQLAITTVGLVISSIFVTYKSYKNITFLRARLKKIAGALGEEEPILGPGEEQEIEAAWVKDLTKCQKVLAGAGFVFGALVAGMQIWRAIETGKEKAQGLQALADNRDSIKTYYDTLIDHQR